MTLQEKEPIYSILIMETGYFACDVGLENGLIKFYEPSNYNFVSQISVKTIFEEGVHQGLVYIGKNVFASFNECAMKVFELKD